MIHGTPREANSLSPVPSAARPSRTALRMLFSFTCYLPWKFSGHGQLASRIRRLLDRIEEAMQVDRGVKGRQPALLLSGPDRLGAQVIHLPDVEGIAAGKLRRRPEGGAGSGMSLGSWLRFAPCPRSFSPRCAETLPVATNVPSRP